VNDKCKGLKGFHVILEKPQEEVLSNEGRLNPTLRTNTNNSFKAKSSYLWNKLEVSDHCIGPRNSPKM
jgi:hypothetical protein